MNIIVYFFPLEKNEWNPNIKCNETLEEKKHGRSGCSEDTKVTLWISTSGGQRGTLGQYEVF